MASHWILVAHCGMVHRWQDNPVGRPKTVTKQYLERLKELANRSPYDCGYAFKRWTAGWLSKHLAHEFGVKVSGYHITRLLKKMGLSIRQKK